MVTYAKDEMVGVTELGKSLGAYLDKVTSHTMNKLAIIRRNKPEAVIVSIEDYEHMKAAAEYLEDLEIYETIKTRVLDRKEEAHMLSTQELKQNLRNRGKNV